MAMTSATNALLRRFHQTLGLPQQTSASWHRARIREELKERRKANTFWDQISETSDVLFSVSRAQYDGFLLRKLPPFSASRHTLPYAYMIGKFSSRCMFYRVLAMLSGAPQAHLVREVVNPSKEAKLHEVALRHGVDPAKFIRIGHRLLKVWPLLP
ncbi:hypothetical protein EJ08DRAFT_647781 [Tothia fuscella]|uniref:Uncharacterized protein n=1 Tax=Tothia fuscella TaxID=1048955 RepID=A0A9P4NXE4_9PEZI|nr:hypothetical protein EJ08DRAFT_647781 [Tothia fuscella]